VDTKYINIRAFEGMSLEQLEQFAQVRNIKITKESLDDIRWEVAIKDAERFKNKGLRMENKPSTLDTMSMDAMTELILELSQRVESLEKLSKSSLDRIEILEGRVSNAK